MRLIFQFTYVQYCICLFVLGFYVSLILFQSHCDGDQVYTSIVKGQNNVVSIIIGDTSELYMETLDRIMFSFQTVCSLCKYCRIYASLITRYISRAMPFTEALLRWSNKIHVDADSSNLSAFSFLLQTECHLFIISKSNIELYKNCKRLLRSQAIKVKGSLNRGFYHATSRGLSKRTAYLNRAFITD